MTANVKYRNNLLDFSSDHYSITAFNQVFSTWIERESAEKQFIYFCLNPESNKWN